MLTTNRGFIWANFSINLLAFSILFLFIAAVQRWIISVSPTLYWAHRCIVFKIFVARYKAQFYQKLMTKPYERMQDKTLHIRNKVKHKEA